MRASILTAPDEPHVHRHVWATVSSSETKQTLFMLSNHGVGEDSSESLGQQGDPTSPS